MKSTWTGRVLAVSLAAVLASCSSLLVHPVIQEPQADGSVRPTCATNSYVWPAVDTVAAALFAVLPILAYRDHNERCDQPGQQCGSTGSLVILWGLGAPIFGGSAYFGYRGVHECRSAGSPSRWERKKQGPPPDASGGSWQITPAR